MPRTSPVTLWEICFQRASPGPKPRMRWPAVVEAHLQTSAGLAVVGAIRGTIGL